MSNSKAQFNIPIDKTALVPGTTYRWSLQQATGNPVNFHAVGREICLVRCLIYNAISNVTVPFQNTQMSYTVPWNNSGTMTTSSYAVNFIPIGTTTAGVYCAIEDFNAIFQQVMFANNHYLLDTNKQPFFFASLSVAGYADRFVVNYIPLPTYADLTSSSSAYNGFTLPPSCFWTSSNMPTGEGYCLQTVIGPNAAAGVTALLSSGLANTLGFPVGTYPVFTGTSASNNNGGTGPVSSTATVAIPSPNVPQVAPVTSLILQCNWVGADKFSAVPQRLSSIPINAGYNEQIVFAPPVLIWEDVLDGTYPDFQLTLADQNGNPLTGLLEGVQITFDIQVRTRGGIPLLPSVPSLPPPYSSVPSSTPMEESGGGLKKRRM